MRPSIVIRSGSCERLRQAGFTLIENMIALAVFAIGMMGVVFLFLNGIGISRTSQNLSQAYIAMQEIVGMMRADTHEVVQYNGVNTTASSGLPPVAAQNVATWAKTLSALPGAPGKRGGFGTIQVIPTQGNLCPCQALVTIYWGASNQYQVETDVDY